jgi:hypothetical protein
VFPLFLMLVTTALLAACVATLVFYKLYPQRPYSTSFFVLMALGAQFLLSFPAGLAQAFHYVTQIQTKPAPLRLVVPVLAAPFNMGGFTTRAAYEAVVGPPAPAKSGLDSGVFSTFHLYLPFLAAQASFFSWLFVRRFRLSRKFADPTMFLLAAAVLANSLLNASWPWWGR